MLFVFLTQPVDQNVVNWDQTTLWSPGRQRDMSPECSEYLRPHCAEQSLLQRRSFSRIYMIDFSRMESYLKGHTKLFREASEHMTV